MKSRKFTLILMHDDGKAHRLRVGNLFFFVLALLLLILPMLGGFGIWTGWIAWNFHQTWQAERHMLDQALADSRLQAERLSNIVRLAGLSTDTKGTMPAAPTMTSSSNSTTTATATNSTAVVAVPVTAPSPPPAVQPLPPTQEPAADARLDEAANIDTGLVRLENFLAREQESRKLRISFDLYNSKPNAGQISGKITFALIDPDGKQHPLDYEDTAFRITRFKKVLVPATLPPVLAGADNSALILTIASDDDVVLLRKIFPVERR